MSPEQARSVYRRYKSAYKRHGISVLLRGRVCYLWRQGRWGPVDAAADVTMAYHDPDRNLAAMWAAADELMRRPSKPSEDKSGGVGVSDPQMEQRCPTLWRYLTLDQYDDGSKRQTSSLLIFVGDGSVKCRVQDKDGERCLWVASRSLVGLLDAVDGALADDDADWRPDRTAKGQSAPRGKR